jgi:RND family efflux transporter MFP subunit
MKHRFLFAALAALPLMAGAQDKGHECLIEPWQRIEIRSPVEALIASVPVERGSQVKKGQLLVALDSSVEDAALAAARYRAKMQGQLNSAESRLNYARIKHQRREDLKQQNFVSAQDKDEAQAELYVAEAAFLEAKENHQAALLEMRRLEELARQRRLLSPFDGIVTERIQNPGELAQTGESARAILKLAQTSVLRVEVLLPASFYGSIKAGQKADIEALAPKATAYAATVQVVDRVVDSASGTFGVRLALQNPSGAIPAGIKCRVRFSR